MTEFHFAHPEWLLASGLSALLVVALASWTAWWRRRAVARFGARAAQEGSASRGRRALKVALLATGVASLFAALAQPRWGYHFEETERRGVDILFAVDTSRSMLARDPSPDRLTRAKLAVSDLVREFEGDRAGLVAFAGEAFLQVPMTVDRDVFARSLAALDTEIIPHGGTNVGAAIREATSALGEDADEKLLVLITDGEDLQGDALEAATDAAEHGVRIFTVGIGSAEGALLEVPGPNGPTLVTDERGEPVRSRLDEETLRAIAEITGGAYEPLGASGAGLSRLYAEHLSHLPRHAVAARQHKVFHERFAWPLGLGLLLLLLEPLLGERRLAARRWRLGRLRAASIASALLVVSAPAAAQDYAVSQRLWRADAPDPRAAEAAYVRGDYETARSVWEAAAARTRRAEHRFNAGTAAYRAGEWTAAEESFEAAVQAGDPRLQQRAYYDLGNARFRRGQDALAREPEEAKAAWRAAIESYAAALALKAEDADARHNLDIVRRALAALEEERASEDPERADPGGAQTPQDQQGQQQGQPGQQGQQQQGEPGQQGQQQDEQQQSEGSPSGGEGERGEEQASSDGAGAEGEPAREREGSARPNDTGSSGDRDDAAREARGAGLRKHVEPKEQLRGGEDEGEGEGETERAETESDDSSGEAEPQTQEPEGGAAGATGGAPEGDDEGEGGVVSFTGSTGPGADVGRLSREQAGQLLRSMRHEDRRFPLTRHRREGAAAASNPTRDW